MSITLTIPTNVVSRVFQVSVAFIIFGIIYYFFLSGATETNKLELDDSLYKDYTFSVYTRDSRHPYITNDTNVIVSIAPEEIIIDDLHFKTDVALTIDYEVVDEESSTGTVTLVYKNNDLILRLLNGEIHEVLLHNKKGKAHYVYSN